MELNAVSVTSSNFQRSIEFYSILGFEFPISKGEEKHIESVNNLTKLMIDSREIVKEITGMTPVPASHSTFAVEYDTPEEIDDVILKLKDSGFRVVKEPWDAFWKQRYAIVEDHDGYKVDLYSNL